MIPNTLDKTIIGLFPRFLMSTWKYLLRIEFGLSFATEPYPKVELVLLPTNYPYNSTSNEYYLIYNLL